MANHSGSYEDNGILALKAIYLFTYSFYCIILPALPVFFPNGFTVFTMTYFTLFMSLSSPFTVPAKITMQIGKLYEFPKTDIIFIYINIHTHIYMYVNINVYILEKINSCLKVEIGEGRHCLLKLYLII